ncbi:MAG: ChbG/HpnK family deacetylase [Candidatus Moranbacteria bacterium]|nr:ChbG/HpnK family deacetylase [Candidatus Moranbacteria bacterium]
MTGEENIIFSADDFGKSERANKNILKLIKLGKIQRVSVMVNREIDKTEIAELLKSGVKLDIHLEIPQLTTYGLPASSARLAKAFGEAQAGRRLMTKTATRSIRFMFLYLAGKTRVEKVEKEWKSQIEKFVNFFNKIPDGLNSHEHVHFFPPYFKIALGLCRQYKIPHLRRGEKIIANKNPIGWIIKLLNQFNKKYLTGYNLQVTGYKNLTSIDWFNNFNQFLQSPSSGTTEIICHPERKDEYKILTQTQSTRP